MFNSGGSGKMSLFPKKVEYLFKKLRCDAKAKDVLLTHIDQQKINK